MHRVKETQELREVESNGEVKQPAEKKHKSDELVAALKLGQRYLHKDTSRLALTFLSITELDALLFVARCTRAAVKTYLPIAQRLIPPDDHKKNDDHDDDEHSSAMALALDLCSHLYEYDDHAWRFPPAQVSVHSLRMMMSSAFARLLVAYFYAVVHPFARCI